MYIYLIYQTYNIIINNQSHQQQHHTSNKKNKYNSNRIIYKWI